MRFQDRIEKLYAKQDYSGKPGIDGVETVALRRHHDDGGSMTELARLDAGNVDGLVGFRLAQTNFSTLEPGVIKAFHVHRRQTDVWFVPPEDRVLLVLLDVREGSPTAGKRMRMLLGDGNSRLVLIPPGVAHGCRNVGSSTARVLYFVDVAFSPEPEATDEGRLPWDMLGPEIWEAARD